MLTFWFFVSATHRMVQRFFGLKTGRKRRNHCLFSRNKSPGYVIQSWMRSRNTLEFLRQWELEQNAEFDDQVCAELIRQGHTTSLTITPTLWVRRTHAVGLHVKQGKGGGVRAYPEIAADFRLWLDPKERLEIISKKL